MILSTYQIGVNISERVSAFAISVFTRSKTMLSCESSAQLLRSDSKTRFSIRPDTFPTFRMLTRLACLLRPSVCCSDLIRADLIPVISVMRLPATHLHHIGFDFKGTTTNLYHIPRSHLPRLLPNARHSSNVVLDVFLHPRWHSTTSSCKPPPYLRTKRYPP
jgi:hypothetical protein